MDAVPITDPGDDRLVDYVGLRRPDRRARTRDAVIVEGVTVLRRVLGTHRHAEIRSILVTPSQWDRLSTELAGTGIPVFVAERDVLANVTGFDVHRGVLASVQRPVAPTLDHVMQSARTIVVLEALNDQENLGAIARTARALGADALLLDPHCADPYTRRVVRVSMGEILNLSVVRVDPWAPTLDHLAGRGFRLLALTPAPNASPLADLSVAPEERVALLLGAEGPGLSDEAIRAATDLVRIPIRAEVDSLNVGHAAAIALAHLGRA